MIRGLLGLLGVTIAAVAAEFNAQVTAIALGDVSGGLGLSHDSATWFTTLYTATEVVGMAISPWLLVTFTLRHHMLFVLLLNATSSALIPYCHDETALYMLRMMQGFSGGLTIPLLMATALRVLSPPIRLYGLAIYALTATFTPALGPAMAGLWTDLVGWQFVFLESLPICAIAAVLVWYGITQDAPDYGRIRGFDWRGFLLIAAGFGSLSVMLQQGDRLDWFDSPMICVLGMVAAVCIPMLLINEWFHPVPLMKLQLLGRRNLAFGAVTLLTFVVIGQSGSALPTDFLAQVQHFRPEQSYTITAVIALAQFAMLPLLAFVLDFRQVDARVVNFLGLALILASCIGCSFVNIRWQRDQFYVWQALQAIGQPMVVMSLLMLATNAVKGPQEAPFASALVNTPRAIAEAAGTWLLQLIDRWRGHLHSERLVDQIGRNRFRLIQANPLLPGHPPPLRPDGLPRAPGSLHAFAEQVAQQTRILTLSDAYVVFACITAALMLVVLILPERTLPPRLQFAKK